MYAITVLMPSMLPLLQLQNGRVGMMGLVLWRHWWDQNWANGSSAGEVLSLWHWINTVPAPQTPNWFAGQQGTFLSPSLHPSGDQLLNPKETTLCPCWEYWLWAKQISTKLLRSSEGVKAKKEKDIFNELKSPLAGLTHFQLNIWLL